MLVANHKKQKLCIQVKDSLGFTDYIVGTGEVNYFASEIFVQKIMLVMKVDIFTQVILFRVVSSFQVPSFGKIEKGLWE